MWRRVNLVWTDVTEECIPSILRVENGGDTFLRNVGLCKIYMAPHPRRRYSSSSHLIRRYVTLDSKEYNEITQEAENETKSQQI
jgi:hypothetical protein